MIIPGPRIINFFGFFACTAMMGFALFAEHVLLLEPCPLCVFQRMAVISSGLIFLVATIQNPSGFGRKIYAGLLLLATGAGILVAGRHVWIQIMPADQVQACGPGFGYIIDSFPFSEALKMIFSGSGECADVVWSFLGLSMPAWVLICLLGLASVGTWNNLRAR